MPDNVARSIMDAHGEGNKQQADFVAHRLQSTAVTFHAPIKINKIHLPGNRHKYRNKSKHVNSTKEDKHLLRQLYMAMHVRGRNSDRLFEVENADCPPSLFKRIDRDHLVHFLRPDASIKSFRDYADKKVIPHIERQLANTKRVDVV